MKKLFGIVVAILVVVVAAYAGTAYWLGQQVERWYRENLAEASNSPNVKLSITRYERGVFSSQAETRVQIVLPQNQNLDQSDQSDQPDPSFTIRQEIYHGPLPLAGWGVPDVPMVWTGAIERDTLDVDSSAWTRALARWYGNQTPLLAVSRIGFDGNADSHITMPPLKLEQIEDLQSLTFSGLDGRFQIAPHNTAIQGQMTVSSLEAIGKSAESGTDQADKFGKISLHDFSVTVNQRKGAFGLMFGESGAKIAELRGEDQQGTPLFSIENLSITGNASQSTPQQVASEATFAVDKFTVAKESGKGSVRVALRQLDGPTMSQIEQWGKKTTDPLEDPLALNELLTLMKALLPGKPEVLLDTQATLTQGEWRGQLTLNFQDPGVIDLIQNPMSVLGILEKGLADINVSKPLLEAVLTGLIKQQLLTQLKDQGQAVDEQAVQAIAQQQVAQQLQELVAAHFIRLEGDRYLSTAHFEGGKLLVNDQEIPLALPTGDAEGMDGETMPMEPDGGILQEEEVLSDPNGSEEIIEEESVEQPAAESNGDAEKAPQKSSTPQGAAKESTTKP